MKTTARVVVIGGGVVGCSVLYHLTKKGWSDVMLIERDQLTSPCVIVVGDVVQGARAWQQAEPQTEAQRFA